MVRAIGCMGGLRALVTGHWIMYAHALIPNAHACV